MGDESRLDLSVDVVALTAALVDVPSESLAEAHLADLVEAAVRDLAHLQVQRFGNTVVARTDLGRAERVVLAGHLDTVPAADNLPSRLEGDRLYGLGSCDMKGGVAVALRVAATLPAPNRDLTFVWYEAEEIEDKYNGLRLLVESRPELLAADLAILLEPTGAGLEGGCQGTLRAEVRTVGKRAHSARAWLGVNAIHAAEPVLAALRDYVARKPVIDGLEYHEGLNAVGIRGGVAGNVIPDECVVTVNYRFAPDQGVAAAMAHVREVFAGFDVEFTDSAAGALPGLGLPAAAEFVALLGSPPKAKLGWTDVARFSALGIPAVNFGPGEPALAHTRDEFVPIEQLRTCEQVLVDWLR
ncbi:MAG: succinyl-diaminopimelate desuccinylase [Actinomycetes bacterium]